MKKILLAIIMIVIGFLGAYSQVSMSTSAYVRGYWTSWDKRNYRTGYSFHRDFQLNGQQINGSISSVEIRENGRQPWDWCFKFEFDRYYKPDKKIRKEYQKSNTWYEYSGWVEYYVTDDYPTIQKVL